MSNERFSLPDGWTWSTIGEVADFLDNRRVPISAIERKKLIDNKPSSALFPYYGANGQVGYIDNFIFDEELVLLAEDGGYFGDKSKSIAYRINGKSWVNNHAHVLRPKQGIELGYLLFVLNQCNIMPYVRGTTRQKLNQSDAKKIPVPLPSTSEQKRIVSKVEGLFAESKILRDALESCPILLRRFRQSVLTKAFIGKLTHRDPNDESAKALLEGLREKQQTKLLNNDEKQNFELPEISELPENWEFARLGEMLEFLQYGTSEKASASKNIGIPILRMGNIKENGLSLSELKYIELNEDEKKKYLLKKDDILINRTNSPELVGKSALFNFEKEYVFASYLIRLQPNPSVLIAPYLNFFINSTYGRRYIDRVKHQVAGQANINSKNIRNMPVPIAPLKEQRRIIKKIEEAFFLSNQIEHAIKKARGQTSRLDYAILVKALKGELTQREPNDEPAKNLLQRLSFTQKTQVSQTSSKKIVVKKDNTVDENYKGILPFLLKNGETSVQKVFEASHKSAGDFLDELEAGINDNRIEQVRKGTLTFLKVKT